MPESFFDKRLKELNEKYGVLEPQELAQAYSGFTFKDRLLLAFIRAHSDNIQIPDLKRIQQANLALFDEKARGRREAIDDTYPLRKMAEWHVMDLSRAEEDPEFKIRSYHRLAKDVSKLSLVFGEETENVERLRKDFADQKESLIASLDEKSIEITNLQLSALEEIERILSIFNVKFYAED